MEDQLIPAALIQVRRRAAELAEAQEKLLALRMAEFRRGQRWGVTSIDRTQERHWAEQAQAEEGKQRAAIHALTDGEVHQTLRREDVIHGWSGGSAGRGSVRPGM